MEVQIDALRCESGLLNFSIALHPVFQELNDRLKGEYGGIMENLWISLELVERGANTDQTPLYPFRFQKRVSGRSHFGLPRMPDKFNVGHFSVCPDFSRIRDLPVEQSISYSLSLIYKSSEVLEGKRRRLGGFNTRLFMAAFRDACKSIGYDIDT